VVAPTTDATIPEPAGVPRSCGQSWGLPELEAMHGRDGYTWNYLENRSLSPYKRGWVRNNLLKLVNGVRGSNRYCSF